MLYLDIIGAGSGYYDRDLVDVSRLYKGIIYSHQTNVYKCYGLISTRPDNKALDKMICDALGIKPSDFTEGDIHLLDVCVNIWCTEQPKVYLYYCGEEVKDKKLRHNIAEKLLDNTYILHAFEREEFYGFYDYDMDEEDIEYLYETLYEDDKYKDGFLYYAMKIILEEDDND